MKVEPKAKLREIAEMFKKQIRNEINEIIIDNDTDDVHNISTQIEVEKIANLPTTDEELVNIEGMIENDVMAHHPMIAMAYAVVKMDEKYIYLDLDIELEADDADDDYENDGYYGDDDDDEDEDVEAYGYHIDDDENY